MKDAADKTQLVTPAPEKAGGSGEYRFIKNINPSEIMQDKEGNPFSFTGTVHVTSDPDEIELLKSLAEKHDILVVAPEGVVAEKTESEPADEVDSKSIEVKADEDVNQPVA